MSAISFAFAALLALQDPSAAGRLTSAPDKRVELDFQHYYDVPELVSTLEKLAGAYPEFVTLETVGESSGGRPLLFATVGERSRGPLETRPALVWVAGLDADDVVGTELVLYALYDLLQNHARDPRATELFARTTLYLVPSVDPDRRAELFAGRARAAEAGAGAVRLDRDFPSAWDPFAEGAGKYPLATPETRGLVTALLARENTVIALASVAGVGARAVDAAAPRAGLAADDHDAFERVLTGLSVRDPLGVASFALRPRVRGDFLEFAFDALGAYPFELRPALGDGVPPPTEIPDLGRAATRALLEFGAALPRLSIEKLAKTRLKSDLWQVEFELANSGRIGGTTRFARERGFADDVALDVSGARLVALGSRDTDANEFTPIVSRANEAPVLAAPGGGERRHVRLIVQGAEGAALVLRARGVRYGEVELRDVLQ
ncbi:MAG: hypothetical protein L6Q99_10875 [Planctomycetes bacterium]|nr:hypothetical protein [Planctomycetota bacterium]